MRRSPLLHIPRRRALSGKIVKPPARISRRHGVTASALILCVGLGLPLTGSDAVTAAVGGSAQSPVAAVDRGLARRVGAAGERLLRDTRAAGFSIAVAERGRMVFADGYGFADVPRRTRARADTIYRTGSVGKQFTAAALLRLAEQGKLSLDDPAAKFLPHLPPALQPVTVRQLLSHTAGLPEMTGIPAFSRSQGIGMTRAEVVDLIKRQPLEFEPGSNWRYSNSGYLLAGAIIEAVAGRPAEEAMVSEVVTPAGLSDTSACRRPPASERWARGYDLQDARGWRRAARLGRPPALVPSRSINLDIVSSAGGFCSTVLDLVRWTEALHRGEVLAPESRRAMVTPATLGDGRRVPYALGLQWRRFGAHRAVGHSGTIWGFNAIVAAFPDNGMTVGLMINTLLPEQEAEGMWTTVLGAVFDKKPARWEELDVGGTAGGSTPGYATGMDRR